MLEKEHPRFKPIRASGSDIPARSTICLPVLLQLLDKLQTYDQGLQTLPPTTCETTDVAEQAHGVNQTRHNKALAQRAVSNRANTTDECGDGGDIIRAV